MDASCRFATTLTTMAVLAGPTVAQEARDWDLHRDPAQKASMAYAQYDSGLGIGFRCIDGAMGVVISGLPPSSQERRQLGMEFGDAPSRGTGWTSTTNGSVVVGDLPAPLARLFRKGGPLRLTVPRGAANGTDLVFVVDLPASNTSIDQVLTECGRPLIDPRDALLADTADEGALTGGVSWQRPPRPTYPRTNYAAGFVVTTCLTTPDGRLTDCLNEMEHPPASRFGAAALRATEAARVRNTQEADQPVPLRRIAFRTRFLMR